MPNQERLRETKHHGAVRFPFNIYPCTIPGDFLQVPLHWHDSMELVYVKKGSGIVQVGVNAYPAEQGDIYIFAPGTLHALHQRGQAVMEYENIIFELELLGGADDLCAERYLLPLQSGRMALQPRIIPGEAGYPQAAACLQEAEEANKVKNAGYELAIKGALLRFLSILKKICRIAYKEGHSEKYHFCHFKLPKQKETTPKALSRENFEKLRDLEIPEKRRSHVITRDLFLFACYTGTAYADAVSITRENLFQDDEGSLWLKYRRKKTDYLGRVKLLPEALALIGKYRDDTRITLFPPQDYHTLRANMKSLRLMAGLSQDLVYHMGRHSFASLVTLEEGVPIETISKMLGHSNIKTTQIYARVTPKRLFEDMDRFVEATRDLKLIL